MKRLQARYTFAGLKSLLILGWRGIAHCAFTVAILSIGAGVALAESQGATQKPLVRIYLNWLPQSQFAGYIMASEKGFFASRGLDVRLIWALPGESSLQMLERGDVEFAAARLDSALFNRAEGSTVVQVMQLYQRCALMLITRKDVQKLEQLNGQVVQTWTWDSRKILEILFKMYKVQPSQILPQSASLAPFISGLVGGAMASEFNEYLQLMNHGLRKDDFNTFAFADYGLGILGDGLYTRQDFARQNEQLVRSVREAIREGWYYAFSHGHETAEVIKNIAESKRHRTNIQHQLAMLQTVHSLITNNGEVPLENMGVLREEDFIFARDVLTRAGYAVEDLTLKSFVVGP